MDNRRWKIRSQSQKIFKKLIISTIVVLIFDSLGWMLDGATFSGARRTAMIVNQLYWFFTLIPCYMGLLFCCCEVSEKLYHKLRKKLAVPIIIEAVLLAINHWTNWIFYIDDMNFYRRGRYFFVTGMLPYMYITIAIALMMFYYSKVSYYERRKYARLSLFLMIPVLGSAMQIFSYGITTIWTSLTISLLMCYVYIQNGTMAKDTLTSLNNRGRFDDYLNWKLQTIHEDETLHLLILDLNRFKLINDSFGHLEGDKALVNCANVLKNLIKKRDAFLARLGGDEFAVIINNSGDIEVQKFIDEIHHEMAKKSDELDKGYNLSFSIGFSGTDGRHRIERCRLIEEADRNMYTQKKKSNCDILRYSDAME